MPMLLRLPFIVSLFIFITSSISAQERYAIAGVDNDKQFVEFYQKFQQAVQSDDSLYISKIICYPLQVVIDINTKLRLKSEREFIANYRKLFDTRLKNLILSQSGNKLFAKSSGIMVGRGQIWFIVTLDNKILISSISNHQGIWQLSNTH
jgi:hypothetical protein